MAGVRGWNLPWSSRLAERQPSGPSAHRPPNGLQENFLIVMDCGEEWFESRPLPACPAGEAVQWLERRSEAKPSFLRHGPCPLFPQGEALRWYVGGAWVTRIVTATVRFALCPATPPNGA